MADFFLHGIVIRIFLLVQKLGWWFFLSLVFNNIFSAQEARLIRRRQKPSPHSISYHNIVLSLNNTLETKNPVLGQNKPLLTWKECCSAIIFDRLDFIVLIMEREREELQVISCLSYWKIKGSTSFSYFTTEIITSP